MRKNVVDPFAVAGRARAGPRWSGQRTMANAEQIKALVRSHADGDDPRFYSVALQVAAHAARNGHVRFAQELRDLIDQAKARGSAGPSPRPTPISRPRGELS